jgi:hypothetical protein
VGNDEYIYLNLYNGSACAIRAITVVVTVLERGEDKTWNPTLTRAYRLVPTEARDALSPLSVGGFFAALGLTFNGEHRFTWKIQDAEGTGY